MANYFTLTLDTVGPDISIVAPQYIAPNESTELCVVANEPLDNYHDIYIVDSAGNRHDLILVHEENRFVGVIDFTMCSLGIATLYARLRDVVGNLSDIVSVNIEVKQHAILRIVVSEAVRGLELTHATREVLLGEKIRYIEVSLE